MDWQDFLSLESGRCGLSPEQEETLLAALPNENAKIGQVKLAGSLNITEAAIKKRLEIIYDKFEAVCPALADQKKGAGKFEILRNYLKKKYYQFYKSPLVPINEKIRFSFTGHNTPVNAVAINAQQVISGSKHDRTLKVWSLATGKELLTLTGHHGGISSVAIIPNKQQVISASDDQTLKVWNLATGEEIFTLEGEDGWEMGCWINAVAVTSNSQQAVSASWLGILTIWNLTTRKEQYTLNAHQHQVNAIAITTNGKQVITASLDGSLKVWNLEKRTRQYTLTGHIGSVNAVAIIPNGQQIISAAEDSTLKVWNLETGKEQYTLTGHSGSVNAVAVTPNGQQVISASDDYTLKVWNLETGENISTFTAEHSLYCCAVAPDGKIIVAGDISGRLHFLSLEYMER